MKGAAILATIIAATVVAPSFAQTMKTAKNPKLPVHHAGEPIKYGNYCWVYTGSHGAGWWDTCDSKYAYPRGKSQDGLPENEIHNIENGGDGGGGGNGR